MKEDSGFTLFELMAVILIIGILAVTAVPSWVAFINQRRINSANDVIFAALQQAQREAKRTKQSYSVSFKTEDTVSGKVPKFAVRPSSAALAATEWKNLNKDLNLKPGQLILSTNFSTNSNGENTAGSSMTSAPTEETAELKFPKITFDYRGILVPAPAMGDKGLIVTVAFPKSGAPTQAIDATRRCIKVRTLLGAMQTGKGNECNAS